MLSLFSVEEHLILWMPSKEQQVSMNRYIRKQAVFFKSFFSVTRSCYSAAPPIGWKEYVKTYRTKWMLLADLNQYKSASCVYFRYFGLITKHPGCQRFACHVFFSDDTTTKLAESVG